MTKQIYVRCFGELSSDEFPESIIWMNIIVFIIYIALINSQSEF